MAPGTPAYVSIGMSSHNSEATIAEAIRSIQVQDTPHWSLSIIDAASTDSTWSICKEFANADSRIIAVRSETQTNWFQNAKSHLKAADHEFFMWADADDCWSQNWLSANLEVLQDCDGCAASFGRLEIIDEHSDIRPHVCTGRTFSNTARSSRALRLLTVCGEPEILGRPNLIYSLWRTDALRGYLPWASQDLYQAKDIQFMTRVLNGCRIGSAPSATIFRRVNGELPENTSLADSQYASSRRLRMSRIRAALTVHVPPDFARIQASQIDNLWTRAAVYAVVSTRRYVSVSFDVFQRIRARINRPSTLSQVK